MLATKTINPLHFEDLDPHRFEDLVRQLMYDYKEWKSIEAIGQMGSDDGIDILATESIYIQDQSFDIETEPDFEDRIWIIQCKREKVITPKKVLQIIKHDLEQKTEIPYGYILVGSTNFSKRTRDAFKLRLNTLGVKEFTLIGKSELEDLLFLPKYDHILFAYFGISLQKRKQSLKSILSSRLTIKRKLYKLLGDSTDIYNKTVFIKPSDDSNYPNIKNGVLVPNWRYYYTFGYQPIDHIGLITAKKYAYANWETGEWDIIEDSDLSFPHFPELLDLNSQYYESMRKRDQDSSILWDSIDEGHRGFYYELKSIHFDRILLVDELGDTFHEGVHLVVNFINGSPFENKTYKIIQPLLKYSDDFLKNPSPEKRVNIFK